MTLSGVVLRILITTSMIMAFVQHSTFGATVKGDPSYFCNGECNVERARCSCTSTCVNDKKCCTDYQESCQGGISWKDTECTSAPDMKCTSEYDIPPPLVIVSIDGFRDIYITRNITPTIAKLADCGSTAPYLRSAYPTKTFPNHHTIATGLYPESHGIIANHFYNHDLEEEFNLGSDASREPHWWGGEPIWVSASNQGLKSASYFWPGSDVNITRYPDYTYLYNQSVPNEERIYQTLDWLDLPKDERPNVIMMYTHIVDTAGHNDGPFGRLINPALRNADEMIEMLMNGLRDRDLDQCVNVMITSDHGMVTVDCPNTQYLEDYGINLDEVYTDLGSFARIGKSPDKALWDRFDAVETMKKLECRREQSHWEAFLKYEYLPKRYHYAVNPWIEDVHLVADDEAWIQGKSSLGPNCNVGEHGYDNAYVDLRAFFLGHGSSFKRSYVRSDPFENIELYNLMCDLLDIDPAPNNGTKGVLYDLLIQHDNIDKENAGKTPGSCPYPNNDNTEDATGCTACEGDDSNERLDLTENQIQQYWNRNMPYGRPRLFRDDVEYCILTQKDYVTTYDNVRRMSLLASFVVERNQSRSWEAKYCARQDVRVQLDSTTTCTEYEGNERISWTFLYFPSLSDPTDQSDAAITSNMIPVYQPFKSMWEFISKSLAQWADEFDGVAVQAGPIFDYDYDGHADTDELIKANGKFVNNSETPIPTHIFLIITRCRDYLTNTDDIKECSKRLKDTEHYSLIIPNYKEAPCHDSSSLDVEWIPASLDRHVARMRDIELLTDISFYSDLVSVGEAKETDILEALRAKVTLPELDDNWWGTIKSNISVTTIEPLSTTSSAQSTSFISKSSVFLPIFITSWIFKSI